MSLQKFPPLHIFILLAWVPYILMKAYAIHKYGLNATDPLLANSFYTFACNIFLINSMGVNDSLSWNYPAWSVSVEFFSYISFFIIVLITKKLVTPIKYLVISFLAYLILYRITDTSLLSTYRYGFLRCVGGFFLGVWIYYSSKLISIPDRPRTSSLLELTCVISALSLVSYSSSNKIIQLITLISFAVVIIVFSVQENGIISQALKNKYMLHLGKISYSIYMTHALIFAVAGNLYKDVFKMPVKTGINENGDLFRSYDIWYANIINILCLGLIIFVSSITYKYIEQPWRNRFRRYASNMN